MLCQNTVWIKPKWPHFVFGRWIFYAICNNVLWSSLSSILAFRKSHLCACKISDISFELEDICAPLKVNQSIQKLSETFFLWNFNKNIHLCSENHCNIVWNRLFKRWIMTRAIIGFDSINDWLNYKWKYGRNPQSSFQQNNISINNYGIKYWKFPHHKCEHF